MERGRDGGGRGGGGAIAVLLQTCIYVYASCRETDIKNTAAFFSFYYYTEWTSARTRRIPVPVNIPIVRFVSGREYLIGELEFTAMFECAIRVWP